MLAVHAWTLGPMADFTWLSRRVLRRESVALLRATIHDAVRLGAAAEFGWSSVEGDAATVLLDAARTAELLVLAARRGTGPANLPFGSVTVRCMREAAVPVVVVPRPVLSGRAGARMAAVIHDRGLTTRYPILDRRDVTALRPGDGRGRV